MSFSIKKRANFSKEEPKKNIDEDELSSMDTCIEIVTKLKEKIVIDKKISKVKQAELVYNQIVDLFEKDQNSKKDSRLNWMRKIIKDGAFKDKISAHVILTKELPLFHLKSINVLFEFSSRHSRRESVHALEGLVELFSKYLLPGKKLISIDQSVKSFNQELSVIDLTCLWFEDRLILYLAKLCDLLKTSMEDSIPSIRKKSIQFTFRLAICRSLQNHKPIELLVNKLGDQNKDLASTALFYIQSLVRRMPHCNQVIGKQLEMVLFRPNVSSRTQFYTICCLSQFIFTSDDTGSSLAGLLIGIYLSYFKTLIPNDTVHSKTMSVLLDAIYRAIPYAEKHYSLFNENIDTLYLLSHSLSFSASIRVLQILHVISTISIEAVTDRFFSALYTRLADVRLFDCSKPAMFLTLLYKALAGDKDLNRILAFIKRLLQVCLQHHNPAFVAASLILISEITSKIHVILFETTGISENEDRFNPTERNPRFCGVDASLGFLCVCRNELELLSSHVHPTISYFATTLTERKSISYQGHPLQDFSSIRFLDRFVFKKPRPMKEEGRVIMSQKKLRHCVGIRALPVNSVQFINSHQSSIPLDERYLHHFFRTIGVDSSGGCSYCVKTDIKTEAVEDSDFDILVGEQKVEADSSDFSLSDDCSDSLESDFQDMTKTAEQFDEMLNAVPKKDKIFKKKDYRRRKVKGRVGK